MVARPVHLNAYEFVAVAALRAKQLLAGCTPRLEGDHNAATMAQMEVAAGCVGRADGTDPARWRQPTKGLGP
ncbi:MAG: DNA-directed RNA polymerase subunit omega [Acidobacteria bacterium]|nr:DNA-directed RNA polymerase subunit omega [Acidobacteriota bacterium]